MTGVTLSCNVLNLLTYFRNQRLIQTWVFTIDWDLDTETFVIKKPKRIFGGIMEERV